MSEIKDTFLMHRTQEDIIDEMGFTESTAKFLANCQPSYGNLIYNEKRRSENDAEIIGFARLPDGTAIRIEGVSKKDGEKVRLPIRVVTVPPTLFNGKEVGFLIPKPKRGFLG